MSESETIQSLNQPQVLARAKGRFFVPPASRFRIYGTPHNYLSVARDLVLNRAWEDTAPVDALEREVAEFLGVRHALALPQARLGIFLAIRALIQPGQEVILSPYTIHDVVNMVICAGARPVFADIVPGTCNIDAAQVAALLSERTGAVLVTHLHGLACDVHEIVELCDERGIPVLEDTAQAFGAMSRGKRLGSIGRAGILSFGMAKNVNSFYGGMLVTNDSSLHERLKRELESFPQQAPSFLLQRVGFCLVGDVLTWRPVFDAATYWIYRYGYLRGIEAITKRWRGEDDPQRKTAIPELYLRRMTPMQARLVRHALPTIDADSKQRIESARMYFEGLRDLQPRLTLPPFRDDLSHIYLAFPIEVPDRHALLRFLTQRGRDLTIQHIGNCADYECFAEFRRDCPNARRTGDGVLLLPTYPGYGRNEVQRNVRLIREFFES
ncbi:MAG: DegT/DnrJ/EryC1/StrS family aminotransferase [Myxococcota bacterium]